MCDRFVCGPPTTQLPRVVLGTKSRCRVSARWRLELSSGGRAASGRSGARVRCARAGGHGGDPRLAPSALLSSPDVPAGPCAHRAEGRFQKRTFAPCPSGRTQRPGAPRWKRSCAIDASFRWEMPRSRGPRILDRRAVLGFQSPRGSGPILSISPSVDCPGHDVADGRRFPGPPKEREDLSHRCLVQGHHLRADVGSHDHQSFRDQAGHRLPHGDCANFMTTSEFIHVEIVTRAVPLRLRIPCLSIPWMDSVFVRARTLGSSSCTAKE